MVRLQNHGAERTIIELLIVLLAVALGVLLLGCSSVKATSGGLTLKLSGSMVSTEGVSVSASDNQGSTLTVTVQKQNVDKEAIKAALGGMLDLASILMRSGTNTATTNPITR